MLGASPTHLDLTTLILAGTSIAALLGLFLLSVSAQERMRALAWWGSAYLLGGFAVALWSIEDRLSPPAPFGLANGVLFLACGMIWAAARMFHGRRVLWGSMAAGATLWLLACVTLESMEHAAPRMLLSSLIASAYTLLTAGELWRERRKDILHRWPAVLVPTLHAAVFLAPVVLAGLMPGRPEASASRWAALFGLEIMLYVVGSAFIILVLAKERRLRMHQDAAFTDDLTGALNRRGFFAAAEQVLAQHVRKRAPLSVLIFDLDHFKSINDRFGHAIGDAALKVFATTAMSTLRNADVFARFGGEEFVVVLLGGLAEARAAAERVRRTFETTARTIEGCSLAATVSVGAASAAADADIRALLAAADGALYRAKANGRNRFEGVEGSTSCAKNDQRNSARPPQLEKVGWEPGMGMTALV